MKKQLISISAAAGIVFLALFVMFVINQTSGIVSLVKEIDPMLGTAVLYVLLAVYAAAVIVPVFIYLKMPNILRPPEDEQSPEYERFLKRLRNRLARNKYLAETGCPLETHDDIDNAIVLLDTHADQITKSTASTVFVTTAVSQNGRLDAIMVLIAQIRLVWSIAYIYNQRPSIREMFDLYVNVAATTFIVGTIEDLDIEEQIEPIITPLISGSVFGGIPGASGVATFMTTSIVDGAANALLTLRVGIITRRQFGIKKVSGRKELRRIASLEAGNMLASIVVKSAGYVTEAIIQASKKRAGSMGISLKDAAVKSAATVSGATKKSAGAIFGILKRQKKDM